MFIINYLKIEIKKQLEPELVKRCNPSEDKASKQ